MAAADKGWAFDSILTEGRKSEQDPGGADGDISSPLGRRGGTFPQKETICHC